MKWTGSSRLGDELRRQEPHTSTQSTNRRRRALGLSTVQQQATLGSGLFLLLLFRLPRPRNTRILPRGRSCYLCALESNE